MKKIITWFKKDWQKIDITKSLIWAIIIFAIFIFLVVLAIVWRNNLWYNALSTIGAVFLAFLVISVAIRLSMFESLFIMSKNYSIKKHNKHYKGLANQQKELYTRESYAQENKDKAWIPTLIYALIYILFIIIGISIYALS